MSLWFNLEELKDETLNRVGQRIYISKATRVRDPRDGMVKTVHRRDIQEGTKKKQWSKIFTR